MLASSCSSHQSCSSCRQSSCGTWQGETTHTQQLESANNYLLTHIHMAHIHMGMRRQLVQLLQSLKTVAWSATPGSCTASCRVC
jgi:hypothetical protein